MDETQLKLLLRTISHDLRGSIGVSSTFAKMLIDEYSKVLDERAVKWLTLMVNESAISQRKLVRLSEYAQLFDYKVQFQKCSLQQIVADCSQSFMGPNNDGNSPRLELMPYNLPEIYTSKELIGVFFVELFSNSFAHAIPALQEQTRRSVKINISYRELNGHHEITYQDNGADLTKDNIKHAVLPFKTLVPSKQNLPHSGMGLSKVQQISRVLNGQIYYDLGTEPFPGLQITLKIPK